jgi:hypothetical protein
MGNLLSLHPSRVASRVIILVRLRVCLFPPPFSEAEGIVSKRQGAPYHGGRAGSWIKVKNPATPGGDARGAEDDRNVKPNQKLERIK